MTKLTWDNGLGLRLNRDGTGTWYWQRRVAGVLRREVVGYWPQMTKQEARARLEQPTLELYLKTIPDTAWGKAHKSRLRRYPLPKAKLEVLTTLDQIPGISAKRSYWDSLRLYGKWAKERELTNPTEGLSAPRSGASRERVLSWPELQNIWQVTDNRGQSQAISIGFGSYVRVLILSAQRRSEVTNFAWKNVEDGLWTNKGKGGFVNMVPIQTFEQYLKDGWAPTTSYSKAKAKLDRASGVYDWTLHDLRRTTSTRLGELGVDPFVIERVLGHKIPGVAGIYNRYKYVPQVAEALVTWAHELKSRLGP